MDVPALPLILSPDPILETRCPPVQEVTDDLTTLARQMLATMYEHKGIGLAAPQVGHSVRLFTLDCSGDHSPMVAFNPTILWRQGHVELEEGCLSFPEVFHTVRRAARIGDGVARA